VEAVTSHSAGRERRKSEAKNKERRLIVKYWISLNMKRRIER